MITITGYQYGVKNQFIGEYTYIYMDEHNAPHPPNTVLIAPPTEIADNQEAIWNGEAWELHDKILVINETPEIVPLTEEELRIYPTGGNSFGT
jgi:hypothetical protein